MTKSTTTLVLAVVAITALLATFAFAALPHGEKLTHQFTFEDYLSEFPEKQQEYHQQRLLKQPFRGFANEYAYRKSIFEAELQEVVSHNAQNKPWRKGLNFFSDLTMEEFLQRFTGNFMGPEEQADLQAYTERSQLNKLLGVSNVENDNNNELIADMTGLPASVDWSSRGTLAKNVYYQGRCGSCYSFVASSLMEHYINAQAGREIQLSTQQAVSCFKNPRSCGGTGGCKGYTSGHVMDDYAKNIGLVQEKDYPYLSGEDGDARECIFDAEKMPVVAKTDGAHRMKPNNPTELLRTLAHIGPASVSVSGSGVKNYLDGVMIDCHGPFNSTYGMYENVLSHAMIAVGYGTTKDGIGYWKLRNTWSNNWGSDGYMKIYRANPGEAELEFINTNPKSGYTCADEDQKPFIVAGTCGVLANTWVPKNPRFIPPPK